MLKAIYTITMIGVFCTGFLVSVLYATLVIAKSKRRLPNSNNRD